MGRVREDGAYIPVGKGNRKLHLLRRQEPEARRWEIRLSHLVDEGSGVQRLWAAVLEQALCEAKGERSPSKGMNWSSVAAKGWFRDAGGPVGSFEFICWELDLPVEEIRRYVLNG